MKLISGRESPTTGQVRFNGLDSKSLSTTTNADPKRIAAYVDQYDLHESMLTVRETLEVRYERRNMQYALCAY